MRGSGGVGIFVKKNLYRDFDIRNLNDDTEGILWLELLHKTTKECLRFCVCYLPPKNSPRAVNAEDFFQTLMYNIYEFQNNSLITVFGDFNARVGNAEDFIAGVDDIPERDVIDFNKNQYCDVFIDFLISTNMCILNGRNYKTNNFTSVSCKGSAVVDFVLVPYEQLNRFSNFDVILATELLQQNTTNHVIGNTKIPDYSCLTWILSLKTILQNEPGKPDENSCTKVKYDTRNIPTEFMCSNAVLLKLNDFIVTLESNQNNQIYVNNVYQSFTNVLQSEMNKYLNPKRILKDGINNKKRRAKRPWWTDELKLLWNDLCTHEKLWLKCKIGAEKSIRKQAYVEKRKNFDKCVQHRKRLYWKEQQTEILNASENSSIFWKTIGKTGIGNERNKTIPTEVINENGVTSTSHEAVLQKWKSDFSKLYNGSNYSDVQNGFGDDTQSTPMHEYNDMLNGGISILEVRKAVKSLNKNKSPGYDNIPAEVIQSDTCIGFLHRLFCVCFETGTIPEAWEYGIITPLLKDSTSDPRNPMNYRGITVTSAIYKAYCNVLNQRLTAWAESTGKITDFQNGFREKRSTIDHLTTLTSIIENRKATKKSTFVAFIDFSKAYDNINRELLRNKLHTYGIGGKIFQSLRALYNNVKCAVKVNHTQTDWFSVTSGLKQGCILSTLLFNLYINDLSDALSKLSKGILVDNTYINHLCYADDLALIAENENDLQCLLDIVSVWCNRNCMSVNFSKTKVIHFRNQSVDKSAFQFKCGELNINYADSYKYLGLVLNEYLNYSVTAKYVAQSATRALGLLISKFKQSGGMPFDVYKKLYYTTVWSVISYGAAVWGVKEYSVINTVQNKACRFFLGVGKYTPNAAVNGDMGWTPPHIKQMTSVLSHWFRLNHMDSDRINKRVFLWSYHSRQKHKNWCFHIDKTLKKTDINLTINMSYNKVHRQSVIETLRNIMFTDYKTEWKNKVLSNVSIAKYTGGNKLRTYKMFKYSYDTESYVKCHILSRTRRSALAKFRCGVAPLRIETGRYEMIPYGERYCFNCENKIESEEHVLLEYIMTYAQSCSQKFNFRISILLTVMKKFVIFYLMIELRFIVPKPANLF